MASPVRPGGRDWSRKFYAMHIGRHNQWGSGRFKRSHRTWWLALLHVIRVKVRCGDEMEIYRCYWDDQGDWAAGNLHWHCGHSKYYKYPVD